MSQYRIRASSQSSEDITTIVAIHRQEIGQGFLSSLGHKALALIFSLAADSESGVLLVARRGVGGPVCGFLFGSTNTSEFYKEFLRRKSLAALVILLPKMLSLKRVYGTLETLLYPSKSDVQDLPKAELLDIAVSKSDQGTGLARQLFHEFTSILRQRGISEFRITTGEKLFRAQRFYEKLGARRVATIEVHRGKTTIAYVYVIPNTSITD